jgi:hypothetical protein
VATGRVARPSSGALLCCPRFVSARTLSELYELSSEVLLGGEGIVGVAAQREIVLCMLAPKREGFQMVELDAVSFGAASSQGVGVSAARRARAEPRVQRPSSRSKTARRTAAGTRLPRRRGDLDSS